MDKRMDKRMQNQSYISHHTESRHDKKGQWICMEIYFVGTVLAKVTRKLIGSTTTICLH